MPLLRVTARDVLDSAVGAARVGIGSISNLPGAQYVQDALDVLSTRVPPGGSVGDVLTKSASADFVAGWQAPAPAPGGDPPGQANETTAGIAEIAAQTETNTGTDDARFITALKLASRTATEARTGLVELATSAETTAGTDATRAVHPFALKGQLDTKAPLGYGLQRVANVTALKLVTGAAHLQTVELMGFASADDRGGGTFYADLNDITSAEITGMLYIADNGVRWKRVHQKGEVWAGWFGARGDGTGNDAAPTQLAIDYVSANGGGKVKQGWGHFRFTTQLVVKSNVMWEGTFPTVQESIPTIPGATSLAGTLNTSIINIDYGAGTYTLDSPTAPAIELRGNSPTVNGLHFYYPNQVKPNAATPTAYPPTVGLGNLPASEVVLNPQVLNCTFYNSYSAIEFRSPHNRSLIDKCWIGHFKEGIVLDGAVGLPRINQIHMMPFYDLFEPGYGSFPQTIDTWVHANKVALRIRRADFCMITNVFCYGSWQGVRLEESPNTTGIWATLQTSSGTMINVQMDESTTAYLFRAAAGWDIYGSRSWAGSFLNTSSSSKFNIYTQSVGLPTDMHPDIRFHGGSHTGPGRTSAQGTISRIRHEAGTLVFHGTTFANFSINPIVDVSGGVSSKKLEMHECEVVPYVSDSVVDLFNWGTNLARLKVTDGHYPYPLTFSHPATPPTVYVLDGNTGAVPDYPNFSTLGGIGAGGTFVDVPFPTSQPDTSYRVMATPTWATTCWVTNKTTTAVRINVGTAPSVASNIQLIVHRNLR